MAILNPRFALYTSKLGVKNMRRLNKASRADLLRGWPLRVVAVVDMVDSV